MRLLKVSEALGLLSQNHQGTLVEGSGSEGTIVDELVLNGFDHTNTGILEKLQWFTILSVNGEISEQRWYSLKETSWRTLKLRDQFTPKSDIISSKHFKEGFHGRLC